MKLTLRHQKDEDNSPLMAPLETGWPASLFSLRNLLDTASHCP